MEGGELERMRLEEGGEREKEGDSWDGVRGKERRRRQEKMECKRQRKTDATSATPGREGVGRWRTGEWRLGHVRQARVEQGLLQREVQRKGRTVGASSSRRFLMCHAARAGVGQTS